MTELLLRGGRLWDGDGDSAEARDVLIGGESITSVAPQLAGDADVVDVSGCTVLPGLIEGHAHLCFSATPDWRSIYDGDSPGRMLLRMAAAARSMVEAGITTVRDLGAPTALAIELRDALAAGLAIGPDLLVAGAPITTTGGHCYFMGGEADGELGVRVAVRERVKAGVDWIKVMASGGNMTPGTNVYAAQYTVRELAAIVQEAHRLNVRVAAHCHGVEGIRNAVEAEVDTLEHCSFQTPDGPLKDDGVIAEIADRELIVSPTVSVGFRRWLGTPRHELRSQLVRQLFASGCRVLMSTDCGIPNVPHAALAGGIAMLADLGGLSPIEALRLATSRSAELLGLDDRGTIEEGKRADLLVVEGDPTTDLGALDRVRLVVAKGEVIFQAPATA